MKKLILIGLAAAIASAAMASTTFLGQTGLIDIPTAVVAPVNSLNFAVDFNNYGGYTTYPLRATYGIAQNWELGAYYRMNTKYAGVTTKWVTPLTGIDSSLGLGATIDTYGKSNSTVFDIYGVLTKEIAMGQDVTLNGHAYVGYNLNGGSTLFPAIGADCTFKNAGNLNAAAEYQFRGPKFSFKASYPLNNNWGVQAGFFDGDLFLGANYTLDTAN